jgi:TetR/AcrR family transcriptional regulator, transcriptional repressor for nem operon
MHDQMPDFKRDPVRTREKLLLSAYEQIHRHGFQAVSLDEILKDTGVTKGALYHHFPNKNALGYAVVDEVISPSLENFWVKPVVDAQDPISALQEVIRRVGENMTIGELRLGCPLNNLSQEMSATDEGFRTRLQAIYDRWRDSLITALNRAIDNGQMTKQLDPGSAAAFIIASLEGCIGMAKNAQDMRLLMQCGAGIIHYLESLKR